MLTASSRKIFEKNGWHATQIAGRKRNNSDNRTLKLRQLSCILFKPARLQTVDFDVELVPLQLLDELKKVGKAGLQARCIRWSDVSIRCPIESPRAAMR